MQDYTRKILCGQTMRDTEQISASHNVSGCTSGQSYACSFAGFGSFPKLGFRISKGNTLREY